MNAIGGFLGRDVAEHGSARLAGEAILRAQAIYAPDPAALWSRGPAALGRRLRPLVPEDAHDRGPVVDDRGRVLVADVRLDNRPELGSALGLGGDARGLSDAALFARALDRWDVAAFDYIVGDFAIAWWDGASGRLLLARDYIGQRPLHYHVAPSFTAFASMPRGLLALPGIPSAPDEVAVAAFAALRPELADRSFFAGVKKVPPGHWVTIMGDDVTVQRYWTPPERTLRLASNGDYVEAVRAHLDTAVAARLRGAGDRVASHLSAGLDSGGVTTTAARMLSRSGGRIVAYTSVPQAGDIPDMAGAGLVDEGPLAAEVAALYDNVEHVLIRAGSRSPIDALESTSRFYDRPLLNLANMAWSDAILDDLRSRGMPILLIGAFGNASFSHGGMERLGEMFRRMQWLSLARESLLLVRGGSRPRAVAAEVLSQSLPPRVLHAVRRLRRRRGDLADFTLARLDGDRLPMTLPRLPHGQGTVQRHLLSFADPGNYMKGMLGGWGVDLRDPTADRRLVEFCLSVPLDQYLADGVPRALARRALADRLPAAILTERRRGQQAADWRTGVERAQAALTAELEHIGRDAQAAALLDLDRARALLSQWPDDEAAWAQAGSTSRYRFALLRGISIGHFLRKVNRTN